MFEFYYRFYNRTGPYAVGLLFGYFMYKNKNINRINGRKLPWLITSCGWVVSTITGLVLVYGMGDYYSVNLGCLAKDAQCFSTAGAVLYAAFARAAWGAVIAWIIFACHTGYAGKFPNVYTTKL